MRCPARLYAAFSGNKPGIQRGASAAGKARNSARAEAPAPTRAGVFGIEEAEWRQPNYARSMADLVENSEVLTRFVAAQLAKDHYFDITAAKQRLGYHVRLSMQDGLQRLRKAWG